MAQKMTALSGLFTRSLTMSLTRGRVSAPRPRSSVPTLWTGSSEPHYLPSGQNISALPACFIQSQRFYNRKKTTRVPPTKPAKFDYSGDLDYTLPSVDASEPKVAFENVEELKTASPVVRDIFSLKYAGRKESFAKQVKGVVERVREHPADLRSLEVKIAEETIQLRNQVHHMSQFRKDKICKKYLIQRIQRRNKNLRILRSRDMEKFSWLLEELKIKYLPLKPNYQNKKLSKRATRKKIARDGFFTAKKDKLLELEKQIKEERKKFDLEKAEELSKIEAELKSMGIEEMESVESVVKSLGMENLLEPKEMRRKRRYAILAKKFELWEQNKNKEVVQT